MRKIAFWWTLLLVLTFTVSPPTHAQAEVVGHLTQVEGRVDILRGGQPPGTPVKVDDGVQPGDVLRTKTLSKAQIRFIDDSTLTIAPGSRVSIEAYMFDSAQNKRNAVLQLFQGLAHVVVKKVFKSADPDFVVKTHTAIMGIRGTEVGIRLYPNFSEFLNFEGRTRVKSNYPEIQGFVDIGAWQGTRVPRNLPPTIPFALSVEDQQQFLNQMAVGLISGKSGGAGTPMGPGAGGGQAGVDPAFVSQGLDNVIQGNLNAPFYTPPLVTPQQVVAPVAPPAQSPPARPPETPPPPSRR